jgi:hypothetical protein
MNCLTTLFLAISSRVAIVIWWFQNPQAHDLPFAGWIIPGIEPFASWIWVVAGAIFLPWTTLAYLLLYPDGLVAYEWMILGVALLVDLVGHTGSYRNRHRLIARRD